MALKYRKTSYPEWKSLLFKTVFCWTFVLKNLTVVSIDVHFHQFQIAPKMDQKSLFLIFEAKKETLKYIFKCFLSFFAGYRYHPVINNI